ncbi:hypothetical protein [Agromyces mariniharenae]|uniref:Uncharacterized protein n=1 Tax=Agromyces mariniharenae TaxID=2604423 RepID=A0A5S4UVP7_9MICO|nr:hypothetical protein [Agromyces mariniharenae]TYL50258.1 hypothetical protein FYC51_13620 [Agromyces mariniharenae]
MLTAIICRSSQCLSRGTRTAVSNSARTNAMCEEHALFQATLIGPAHEDWFVAAQLGGDDGEHVIEEFILQDDWTRTIEVQCTHDSDEVPPWHAKARRRVVWCAGPSFNAFAPGDCGGRADI